MDRGEASRVCGSERACLSEEQEWAERRLPFESSSDDFISDEERPRLLKLVTVGVVGERMPKNILGHHCDFSDLGERDRAGRFSCRTVGEVFERGRNDLGGACRGVINLSAGFKVLRSPSAIEVIEALRHRSGCTSTGTQRRLTGWPGR